MIVEEGKVRDLADVEELLYCWKNLKCPVFIDLEFEQSVSTAAEKGGHVTNNINMKSELKTKMARRRSTKGRTNYNRRAEAKYYYSVMMRRQRRYLSGPGSSPPRCTGKCGKCTPCKPVHVPVPPGTPVTTEYYPEAWRCKCGNKLYMP
ncbi:EPIDERMAL PATTERNING FACTOR-like protein 3 isoform X2 [Malania oleifera]|uniref:EPIDERMAL PATTERNING FACTOR-like protein 3 isoform X2 n=1 Tax=Malania oleifera TaxID=397392 RepID=UPI0025ADFB2B|nr:EPIDERMAL PATTERNING FACTOR-like protein 3 isoform X2 [Malania oleifera]